MKKIFFNLLSILMCFICLSCVFTGCKAESDHNSTFTLKTYDTKYLSNCSIKSVSQSQPSSVSYTITPVGFDLDELNIQGYYMTITISYSVKYKKDTLLPDFMYAGSPTYKLTALTSDLIGLQKSGLSTTTIEKNVSFSYSFDIVNIMNSKISLTFSTDNVQNVIYFSNIKLSYSCKKY